MTPTPDDASGAAMALLGLKFRQRLPLRAQALQAAWSAWQVAPAGLVPAALVRELHSLAGAAGLHGLDNLGSQARALEQACLEPDAPNTAHAQAFARLLCQLNKQASAQPPD